MAKSNKKPDHSQLKGGKSKDTLDATKHSDTESTLQGGQGSDTYVIGSNKHHVFETNSGEGKADAVKASNLDGSLSSYTLGDNLENLILVDNKDASKNVIEGHGNALDNDILGNRANNLLDGGEGKDDLDGGAGDDTLSGGAGVDELLGGAGNDTLIFDAADKKIWGGKGVDTLQITGHDNDLVLGDLKQLKDIEIIDLTGDGNNTLSLTAKALAKLSETSDTLRVDGDAGDVVKVLDAGWTQIGDVTIDGVTYDQYTNGKATLQVEDAIDRSSLGADSTGGGDTGGGGDTNPTPITGGEDYNYLLGTDKNDSIFGGGGHDILEGNGGNDTLDGGDGNDSIYAGIGNDSLVGGTGNDQINYSGGNDTIDGGEGTDKLSLQPYAEKFIDFTNPLLSFKNFESLDMGWGTVAKFDLASLSKFMGGGKSLTITGYSSTLFLEGVWTYKGNISIEGEYHTFATYTNGDITLNIDTNIDRSKILLDVSNTENQYLIADDQNKSLTGEFGNDTLIGSSDHNDLFGNSGNDSISAGSGDDHIMGGYGNDTIDAGDGNDDIWTEFGDDSITAGAGNDSIYGSYGKDSIYAGVGNDVIDFTYSRSKILSGSLINGGDGVDTLRLNYGESLDLTNTPFSISNIEVIQISGSLTLDADSLVNISDTSNTLRIDGSGKVFSPDGWERIADITFDYSKYAQYKHGNAILQIRSGIDVTNITLTNGDAKPIFGTDDNDTIIGGMDKDKISGGAGNDSISGGDSNDSLSGGNGADTLVGDEANDTLSGGSGDDKLDGGSGNDLLIGGEGNDTFNSGYWWGSKSDIDTISVDAGIDTVYFTSQSNDVLNVSDGATAILKQLSFDLVPMYYTYIQPIQFPATNSQIVPMYYPYIQSIQLSATNGHNEGTIIINGGDGADSLTGSDGHDIISGGKNNGGSSYIVTASGRYITIYGDVMTGGAGKDTFVFDMLTDTSGAWSKADVITDFTTGEDQLALNSPAGTSKNYIEENGTSFADEAATLAAARAALDGTVKYYLAYNVNGDGYLYFDADGVDGGERVIKLQGLKNASDFNFSDITQAENAIIGTNANNNLTGTDSDNTLYGGMGDDTLTGGLGHDTFDIDSGSDLITDWDSGSPNGTYPYRIGDFLNVSEGASALIKGSNQSEVIAVTNTNNTGTIEIDGGNGNDTLGGSTSNDLLEGGAGNDMIFSNAGQDTLTGGAGDDTLYGGYYSSGITYNVDSGTDSIYSLRANDQLNVALDATAIVNDNSTYMPEFGTYTSYSYLGWAWVNLTVSTESVYAPLSLDMAPYLLNDYNKISVTNAINQGTIILKGDTGFYLKQTLIGSNGKDQIYGGGSVDTISGGAGDDTIDGGANIRLPYSNLDESINVGDHLTGGDGKDIFVFDMTTDSGNYTSQSIFDVTTNKYITAPAEGSTWHTADEITDFTTASDKLDVSTAAGTASNYHAQDGSGFTTEADVLKAAQDALDGTTQYFFAYKVNGDGYLYYDADGVNGDEVVIKLDGLKSLDSFHFGDII